MLSVTACFQPIACGLCIAFPLTSGGGWRQCRTSRRHLMTLRIERSTRQRFTVFTLSGHERGGGRGTEGALCYGPPKHRVGLTRREATDRDAVRFLKGCEADGMNFENCPAYVREWMERQKDCQTDLRT